MHTKFIIRIKIWGNEPDFPVKYEFFTGVIAIDVFYCIWILFYSVSKRKADLIHATIALTLQVV